MRQPQCLASTCPSQCMLIRKFRCLQLMVCRQVRILSLHLQVPSQVYVTDKLPKTATGKIQRRHMVTAFVKKGDQPPADAQAAGGHVPLKIAPEWPCVHLARQTACRVGQSVSAA